MATKAKMFNKQASDPENKPDEILKALSVQTGAKVVDIGAGGGYFALRFAEVVGPQGHVYAVDTNAGKLEYIRKIAIEKGLGNVETVLAGKDGVSLPMKVNLIFLRNVYHHIPSRIDYFVKLRQLLEPDECLAIVEHKPGRGFHSLFEHRVSGETIIEEMEKAGYQVNKSLDILPKQSFNIFVPKKN